MHTKPKARDTALKPIEDRARLDAIINAISKLDCSDLEKHHAWNELDELSSQTIFEGVEPHPDGIFETGSNTFEAVATVYVTLNYGGRKDGTSMSDSYPARVRGKFSASNKIDVESLSVDTSSFYR